MKREKQAATATKGRGRAQTKTRGDARGDTRGGDREGVALGEGGYLGLRCQELGGRSGGGFVLRTARWRQAPRETKNRVQSAAVGPRRGRPAAGCLAEGRREERGAWRLENESEKKTTPVGEGHSSIKGPLDTEQRSKGGPEGLSVGGDCGLTSSLVERVSRLASSASAGGVSKNSFSATTASASSLAKPMAMTVQKSAMQIDLMVL